MRTWKCVFTWKFTNFGWAISQSEKRIGWSRSEVRCSLFFQVTCSSARKETRWEKRAFFRSKLAMSVKTSSLLFLHHFWNELSLFASGQKKFNLIHYSSIRLATLDFKTTAAAARKKLRHFQASWTLFLPRSEVLTQQGTHSPDSEESEANPEPPKHAHPLGLSVVFAFLSETG